MPQIDYFHGFLKEINLGFQDWRLKKVPEIIDMIWLTLNFNENAECSWFA